MNELQGNLLVILLPALLVVFSLFAQSPTVRWVGGILGGTALMVQLANLGVLEDCMVTYVAKVHLCDSLPLELAQWVSDWAVMSFAVGMIIGVPLVALLIVLEVRARLRHRPGN